jgi:pimeloyl-ACP methyl ester carboxylesterase
VTTFVLVHGAWHGGWCWQLVARELRAAGADVLAPTLTGLGERAHLLTPEVDLQTHVRDIVAVLETENLRDVVLVGHSYAGMVVTSVAASIPERLASVVVVDGFLPVAGECALELLPTHAAAHYRDSVVDQGSGPVIPPRPLANLGVTDQAAIAWLEDRLVPQPALTYSEPSPWGVGDVQVPGVFVLCSGWASPFEAMAVRAESFGWSLRTVDADHEVMATHPDALTRCLRDVARATESPSLVGEVT